VPPLVRGKPLRSEGYLSGHAQPELVIRNLKESQQLSDEDPDIGFVNKRIRQFQRTPSNRDITVSQTVKDDITVSLYSIGVD
jgi:hypothetical protein